MCEILEDMCIQEREKGRKKAKIDAAKRMVADGIIPIEKIVQYTELPLDEVKKLQAENAAL